MRKRATIRKLEKAVAVSGVFAGVLEESSGKVPGNFSRIAKCCKFQDFGHRERQTCREPWVHTAGTLSLPSVRGVFRNRQFQPSRVFLKQGKNRSCQKSLCRRAAQRTYKRLAFRVSKSAIPGSPYRCQNWRIRKMTFLGSKNAFLGVPLGTISMGFLGHLIPSLNTILVKGRN